MLNQRIDDFRNSETSAGNDVSANHGPHDDPARHPPAPRPWRQEQAKASAGNETRINETSAGSNVSTNHGPRDDSSPSVCPASMASRTGEGKREQQNKNQRNKRWQRRPRQAWIQPAIFLSNSHGFKNRRMQERRQLDNPLWHLATFRQTMPGGRALERNSSRHSRLLRKTWSAIRLKAWTA